MPAHPSPLTRSSLCTIEYHEHCTARCDCACHSTWQTDSSFTRFLYECWQSPSVRGLLAAEAREARKPASTFTPLWDLTAAWYTTHVEPNGPDMNLQAIRAHEALLREVLADSMWDLRAIEARIAATLGESARP